MKDQLCSLLITFSDFNNPSKETTTAHMFSSTDPRHYPQRRKVVHSQHIDSIQSANIGKQSDANVITKRISRSAHAADVGSLGSDMVEHRQTKQKQHHIPSQQESAPRHASATRSQSQSATQVMTPSPAATLLSSSSRQSQYPNTCTSGSSIGGSPAHSSQLSIQEVTLSYSKTKTDQHHAVTRSETKTVFPAAGPLEVHYRDISIEKRAGPYRVHHTSGQVEYGPGEYFQVTDYPGETRPQPATTLPQTQKTVEHYYTTPLNVQTDSEKQYRGKPPQKTPPHIRFEGDSSPRDPQQRRPSSTPLTHHKERSFEAIEQSSVQKNGATQKTIFERTTRELMTSTSKAVTTNYGPSQPVVGLHRPLSQGPQLIERPVGTGLPRYYDDTDIRLYTRYGDFSDIDRERKRPRVEGGRRVPADLPSQHPAPIIKAKKGETRFGTSWEDHDRDRNIPHIQQYEMREVTRVEQIVRSQANQPSVIPFGSSKNFSDAERRSQSQPPRWPTPPQQPPPTPPITEGIVKPRLIDYDTYRREVEQLQREAAKIEFPELRIDASDSGAVPLSPAVVVSPVEARQKYEESHVKTPPPYKYFTKSELTKNEKVIKSAATPINTPDTDEHIRTTTKFGPEFFRSTVETIESSSRFRPLHQEAPTIEKPSSMETSKQSVLVTEFPKEVPQIHLPREIQPEELAETLLEHLKPLLELEKQQRSQRSSRAGTPPERRRSGPLYVEKSIEKEVHISSYVETGKETVSKEEARAKEEPKVEHRGVDKATQLAPKEEEKAELVSAAVQSELPVPHTDIGTQVRLENEESARRMDSLDLVDRSSRLMETLRRELQVEESIDYEVRRRQRIINEPSTGQQLEEVREEEHDSSHVDERQHDVAHERKETDESGPSISIFPPEEETTEKSEYESKTVTTKTVSSPTPPAIKQKEIEPSPPATPRTTSTAELKFRTPSPRMDYKSESEYRSNISSRQGFTRPHRALSPNPTSHRVLKMVSETSSLNSAALSPYGSTAASTIRDTREREKKEMSDLNDRLANYIEKVRFLEAQNRKLAADLEFLRDRWGKDTTSVRDMYEGELRQARKLIDETNRQRDELGASLNKLQEEINALRRRYDDLVKSRHFDKEKIEELLLKLSALEGEIALLKRRIALLEADVNAVKKENHRLLSELQRARNDLDQETLNRIDFQNQVQTLLEEIDFLRRAHDSEIQDLHAMVSRDTTSENREYFKNELASAIREIREEYDKICGAQRVDMESWYKLKVQEIQTQSVRQNMEQIYAKEEVKRLRVQLGDLRGKLADLESRNSLLEKQAEELNYQLEDDQRSYESALNDRDSQIRKIRDECQMLMVELQMLLDTKQTLDAEIAIYRKMLEGEEDRAGLRQLVEQVVRTHHYKQADETESMRVLRGESSSRNSYQRSAKGNVSICEAAPDGKYVVLENTHRSKEEHIGEWKLKRRIDGRREIVYTFPRDFIIRPGKSVKIWARNQGIHNPPDELVFDGEDSFGSGNNVQTILYNTQGEERATLIQRSNYTVTGH